MFRRLLRRIFGYDEWEDQSSSTGSIFHERTPAEHLDAFSFKKYNRQQRRGKHFVLIDERTGMFVRQYKKDGDFHYTLDELDKASIWKSLERVKSAGDWAWAYDPTWHLTYQLVFLDKNGKRDTF